MRIFEKNFAEKKCEIFMRTGSHIKMCDSSFFDMKKFEYASKRKKNIIELCIKHFYSEKGEEKLLLKYI